MSIESMYEFKTRWGLGDASSRFTECQISFEAVSKRNFEILIATPTLFGAEKSDRSQSSVPGTPRVFRPPAAQVRGGDAGPLPPGPGPRCPPRRLAGWPGLLPFISFPPALACPSVQLSAAQLAWHGVVWCLPGVAFVAQMTLIPILS